MEPMNSGSSNPYVNNVIDNAPLLQQQEALDTLNEEEREQEAQVPPFGATCWNHPICYWCRQFPVAWGVLLVNVFCFAVVIRGYLLRGARMPYYRGDYRFDDFFNSEQEKQQILEKNEIIDQQAKLFLTASLALSVAVYLVDSFIFWREARKMEKQVEEYIARETQNNDDAMGSAGQGLQRPSGRLPTDEPCPDSTHTGSASSNGSRSSVEGGNNDKKINFVELSMSVDAAFGCGNLFSSLSSSSTVLVAFFYALFAVTLAAAVSSTAHLLRVQLFTPVTKIYDAVYCQTEGPYIPNYKETSQGDQEQYGIATLQEARHFEKLPLNVQAWIKSQPTKRDRIIGSSAGFNRSLPFIHHHDKENIKNSMMVFPFLKQKDGNKNGGSALFGPFSQPKNALAVYYPINDTLTEYIATTSKEDGFLPPFVNQEVLLVGFPTNNAPYTNGWCGLFDLVRDSILQDEAICYNSQTQKIKHFLPVKKHADDDDTDPMERRQRSMYATKDTLWIATHRSTVTMGLPSMMRRHRGGQIAEEHISYVSLVAINVDTLERTLKAERNITTRIDTGEADSFLNKANTVVNKGCRVGYHVGLWTSFLSMSLIAFYLYRLDIPSCVLPACVALTMILYWLLPVVWAGGFLLLVSCLCIRMLAKKPNEFRTIAFWKFVSTEMMVWSLYAFLTCAVWGSWQKFGFSLYLRWQWDDLDFFLARERSCDILILLATLLVSVAITAVLNHPIFLLLSAILFICGILSGPFVFFGVGSVTLLPLYIPFLLFVISLGCYQAHGLLQHYRVHLLVYSRRVWRGFKAACYKCLGMRRDGGAVIWWSKDS